MSLIEFMTSVVQELKRQEIRFALAGGIVASLYRKKPRATHDLDFLIFCDSAEIVAVKLIKIFGLEPRRLRKAELEGGPMFAIKRQTTPICIVAGRSSAKEGIGLDLLLPELPWAERAIDRARDNLIDFGFGEIPSLTLEDLLLSKLYAFRNQSTRFMDLDDLKSIFESNLDIDIRYLGAQMRALGLNIPAQLKPFVPKLLIKFTSKK